MIRKLLAAACTAALIPVMLASPAAADSDSTAVVMSGSGDLGTDTYTTSTGTDDGDVQASGSVHTTVAWSQPGVVGVEWDPNLVRQGRSLDPTVSWTPTAPGGLTAHFTVDASACVWFDGSCYGFTVGPMTFDASGACSLLPGGADYTCDLSSAEVEIFEPCPDLFNSGETSTCPLSPRVTAHLASHVTVSPQEFATLRTATLAGDTLDTADLGLQIAPITDSLGVPCSAGVGDELGYGLGDFSTQPGLNMATSLVFSIQFSEPVPAPVTFPYIDIASPSVSLGTDTGSATLTGGGHDFVLGNVQANNIAPVLTVADEFSGDEGTPIQFNATATGPCAAGASYAWHFSDGTTAFGAHPKKPFQDSGPFTGSVTVTDTTGLTDTEDFDVTVANLAPSVQVLPNDPTVAWGRNLSLEAQALDPGADDQADLTYAWTFGDSTPVVIGGRTETHAWALPGTYAASVKVCDDDGGCTTDPFTVNVRQRTTSVAYTGQNAAAYSSTATLSGSLVDEFGNAVNGASLGFTFGGTPAGTALTNASGNASRSFVIALPAGAYDVTSAFAGNTLYAASGPATESFDVSAMASTITWTGTTTGKPNKDVPLAAKLVDALGRPLAGYQVTFRIGTQSVNATTNASGVATATIKLNQKPGTYASQVFWAGDPGRYLADDATGGFKINTK
jgi:hypothetical protein